MPTKSSDTPDTDEQYNPGQQHSNDLFDRHGSGSGKTTKEGGTNQAPTGFGNNQSDSKSGIKNLKKDEQKGLYYPSSISPKGFLAGKSKKQKTLGGTMIAAIITLFIAGGFFSTNMFALVHVKEVLSEKFNDIFPVLDIRSKKIIQSRLDNATKGGCKTVKVACRYNGMSKRQVNRLKDAGITAVDRDGNAIDPNNKNGRGVTGKYRVGALEFPDGQRVTANNLYSTLKNNSDARRSMTQAYNPRIIAYANSKFGQLASRLKITKKRNITGDNKKDFDSSMKKSVQGDLPDSRVGISCTGDGAARRCTDSLGNEIDPNDAKSTQDANKQLKGLVDEAKDGPKLKAGKKAVSLLKVPGLSAVDTACSAWFSIKTVSYGAKAIMAASTIRFLWTFANTADRIKAGDEKLTGDQVNYIASKLTTKDENGQTFYDSTGWRYAETGKVDVPEDEKTKNDTFKFSSGAGTIGALATASYLIDSQVPGDPDDVCGKFKNPWVQGGLIVGGVISAAFSGGTSLLVNAGSVILGSVAVQAVMEHLIEMLAGTVVTNQTHGGMAGNAAVAGMGALNAKNSRIQGLAPQTVNQRIAYEKDVVAPHLAMYNQTMASQVAFYDTSSQFSLFGKMARQLSTTLMSHQSSLISLLAVPGQMLSSLKNSLLPSVSALSEKERWSMCADPYYRQQNLATGPFCNIRYGMESDALNNTSPDRVVEYMLNNEYITDSGEAQGEYKTFIEDCIVRATPFGYKGPEGQQNEGGKCIQGGNNSTKQTYFRLYYIDTALTDHMDNEPTAGGGGSNQQGEVGGDVQKLAQTILDNSDGNGTNTWNIKNAYSSIGPNAAADKQSRSTAIQQLQDIVAGKQASPSTRCGYDLSPITPDPAIMQFLAEAAKSGVGSGMSLNALFGQCHSEGSQHYSGEAVDLGCNISGSELNELDEIASNYGVSRNFENCAQHSHWHYKVDG